MIKTPRSELVPGLPNSPDSQGRGHDFPKFPNPSLAGRDAQAAQIAAC
jgi:hypothetical protein